MKLFGPKSGDGSAAEQEQAVSAKPSRKKKKLALAGPPAQTTSGDGEPWDDAAMLASILPARGALQRDEQGRMILAAGGSPLGSFCGVLLFSLIWNGVTSVFAWKVIASFRAGNPEWFLTIFVTPFVLVGMALLALLGYTFLTLFNPRPTVAISRTEVALGDRLEIAWKFSGNAAKVTRLTLSLVGTERATYTRGTSTYTDTEEFCRLEFLNTDHPPQIAAGTQELTLPALAMHTFDATHNKVTWELQLHGTIQRWPDVSVAFPITVLPFLMASDERPPGQPDVSGEVA